MGDLPCLQHSSLNPHQIKFMNVFLQPIMLSVDIWQKAATFCLVYYMCDTNPICGKICLVKEQLGTLW